MGDLVLIEDARAEREQELRGQRENLADHLERLAARAGEIIGVCVGFDSERPEGHRDKRA